MGTKLCSVLRVTTMTIVPSRRSLAAMLLACVGVFGRDTSKAVADEMDTKPTAEKISISTRDGWTFTAAVDAKTNNEELLWLRFEGAASAITRPVAWEDIESIQRGDQSLTVEELRGAISELKSERTWRWASRRAEEVKPASTADALPSPKSVVPPTPANPIPAHHDATKIPANDRELPAEERVGALQISAGVAHFGANAEVDGLMLSVYPVGVMGNLVPVSGTLEVELIGERRGPAMIAQDFPLLGRWVQQVRPEDLGPAGAVYPLPFQAIHPEFSRDIGSQGLVHARLSVPGQGTFEATASMVRIRPYSSVRDHMQQVQGSRFSPYERTGRGN